MTVVIERNIIGAITLEALRSGCDVDFQSAGAQILCKVQRGELQAGLWLTLGNGTDLINDADGSDKLYAPLLEVAQAVCEEYWTDEA